MLAVFQTCIFYNAAVTRNHFYLGPLSSFHWGHQNVEGDGMPMAHSRGKIDENYDS